MGPQGFEWIEHETQMDRSTKWGNDFCRLKILYNFYDIGKMAWTDYYRLQTVIQMKTTPQEILFNFVLRALIDMV